MADGINCVVSFLDFQNSCDIVPLSSLRPFPIIAWVSNNNFSIPVLFMISKQVVFIILYIYKPSENPSEKLLSSINTDCKIKVCYSGHSLYLFLKTSDTTLQVIRPVLEIISS